MYFHKSCSTCMRTVASSKVAPAYVVQSTDWWIASHRRADFRLDTQQVSFHPHGSCMQMQTLYVSFVLACCRKTIQKVVVSYVVVNECHSSAVTRDIGLPLDAWPKVPWHGSHLVYVHGGWTFKLSYVLVSMWCWNCVSADMHSTEPAVEV